MHAAKDSANTGMAMAAKHQAAVEHSIHVTTDALDAHLHKLAAVAADVARTKRARGQDMLRASRESIKTAKKQMAEAAEAFGQTKKASAKIVADATKAAQLDRDRSLSAQDKLQRIIGKTARRVNTAAETKMSVDDAEQREIRQQRREIREGQREIAASKTVSKTPLAMAKEAAEKAVRTKSFKRGHRSVPEAVVAYRKKAKGLTGAVNRATNYKLNQKQPVQILRDP